MAGRKVEVRASPTKNDNYLMDSIQNIDPLGRIHLYESLSIAYVLFRIYILYRWL